MEKKNICILINSEFPYMSGERFLESEIGYLCDAFSGVLMFPLFPNSKCKKTRSIPKNLECHPLNITKGKLKYFKYIMLGIFSKNNLSTEKDIDANTIRKKIVCLYAKGRSSESFKRIKRKIRKIDLDNLDIVIYSYWFNDHSLTALNLGEYLKEKTNSSIKIISRAHGYDLYDYRNSINFLPYRLNQLNNIDFVFPCSNDGVRYLLEKYPNYLDKIKLAHLGTKDEGLPEIQCSTCFQLATCSNIVSVKRLFLIEEALEIIAKKGYLFKWICIGDGILLPKLIEKVENSEIKDYVEFKGNLENSKVLDLYKHNQINLFCNVSEAEGLPVSIMEALSFGIPCIATNVGGTSDLVDDSVGKLLKPNITPNELANEIILFIIMNDSSYYDIRKKARERWEKRSSSKVNYEKWCNTLLSL